MALTFAAEPVPLATDADGTVRVGGTRLTLDTVLGAFERGDSPVEITVAFPWLDLADVYLIIAYYLRHRDEVDHYLRDQDAKADEYRRRFEALQGDQRNLRETLLARLAQRRSD